MPAKPQNDARPHPDHPEVAQVTVGRSISRRALLQARPVSADHPRPPGALASPAFEDLCSQCGDCARACAEGVILRDAAGFPVIDPQSGACTFCGACSEACDTGALARGLDFPWRAGVEASCLSMNAIACRACEDQCDTRAIRFRPMTGGRAAPVFDPDLCNGCGACVAPCPAGAISLYRAQPTPTPDPTRTETRRC